MHPFPLIPLRKVINLCKLEGVQSLASESSSGAEMKLKGILYIFQNTHLAI